MGVCGAAVVRQRAEQRVDVLLVACDPAGAVGRVTHDVVAQAGDSSVDVRAGSARRRVTGDDRVSEYDVRCPAGAAKPATVCSRVQRDRGVGDRDRAVRVKPATRLAARIAAQRNVRQIGRRTGATGVDSGSVGARLIPGNGYACKTILPPSLKIPPPQLLPAPVATLPLTVESEMNSVAFQAYIPPPYLP